LHVPVGMVGVRTALPPRLWLGVVRFQPLNGSRGARSLSARRACARRRTRTSRSRGWRGLRWPPSLTAPPQTRTRMRTRSVRLSVRLMRTPSRARRPQGRRLRWLALARGIGAPPSLKQQQQQQQQQLHHLGVVPVGRPVEEPSSHRPGPDSCGPSPLPLYLPPRGALSRGKAGEVS